MLKIHHIFLQTKVISLLNLKIYTKKSKVYSIIFAVDLTSLYLSLSVLSTTTQ